MASKVKCHEVDRKIIYDFVYMSFIETLLIAFTFASPNITKVHIDYSNLENDLYSALNSNQI